MRSEQFQNLSLKEANEIFEMAAQLMAVAEKLFCIVRGVIDDASMDPASTCLN